MSEEHECEYKLIMEAQNSNMKRLITDLEQVEGQLRRAQKRCCYIDYGDDGCPHDHVTPLASLKEEEPACERVSDKCSDAYCDHAHPTKCAIHGGDWPDDHDTTSCITRIREVWNGARQLESEPSP